MFIRFLQKCATGRTVLVLFVITMIVYIVILTYSIPAVLKLAPDMALFDMSPMGYSFDYAMKLLSAIGTEGRQTYRTLQLPIDFVYPGLFAITYTLLLTWLFKKGFSQGSPVFYFALVPMLAGFFDYLENIGIIQMLNAYPNLSVNIVFFTSVNSMLKSTFTIGFYILLLVAVISLIRRRFVSR